MEANGGWLEALLWQRLASKTVPAHPSQTLPRCPSIFSSSKHSHSNRKAHLSEGPPPPVDSMFLSECLSPLPQQGSQPCLRNLEVGSSRALSPSFCDPSSGLTFHTGIPGHPPTWGGITPPPEKPPVQLQLGLAMLLNFSVSQGPAFSSG